MVESATSTHSTAPALGRLKSLGPSQPWQAALLLPSHWRDYRQPASRFEPLHDDSEVVIDGELVANAQTGFHNKIPRLQASIMGMDGVSIGITLFGDHRELARTLTAGTRVAAEGRIVRLGSGMYLNNAAIVDHAWLGRLCPIYPGKPRSIRPETVRERVLTLLPEVIDETIDHLLTGLEGYGGPITALAHLGIQPNQLRAVIKRAHLPDTPKQGERAQRIIEQIAAMHAVAAAANSRPDKQTARAFDIDWTKVRRRVATLPYPLTQEQRQAAFDIQTDLGQARPMRRILSGDVGTGKTVVYGLAAAACADHGGQVVILAPTQPLASQIHAELSAYWPDLDIALVAGGAAKNHQASSAAIRVGTTALLHRESAPPHMMIVDEQQKFSRDQRERLTAHGCHLLEVSGTAIPRSIALIRYGALDVSKLTKAHTPKRFHSRLWAQHERGDLMSSVESTIAKGGQVLAVYPLKEGEGRNAAEHAFQIWERRMPGRVALVHANMSDDDKKAAVDALKNSQADLLVATTVVEVGISIPNLTYVLVVEPQRLGLTQLHQIRGRAARHGGDGYFSMYPQTELKPEAASRLQVLLETTDGFEIAERDLALRGYGSLAANADTQTGDDELVYGRSVRLEQLDQAMGWLKAGQDQHAIA